MCPWSADNLPPNRPDVLLTGFRSLERLSMSSLFWANLRAEKNQKKREVEKCIQQGMKECTTQAQGCQAASLSLTALSLRGLKRACQVESPKNAGILARGEATSLDQRLLGRSAGVLLLCQFKGRRLITLSTGPHRKEDPHPHIQTFPYADIVAFALHSFALIVVLSPCFTLGRLSRTLMQGVAQRFDATQPTMSLGIHATLIQHWRCSFQCLQTACI